MEYQPALMPESIHRPVRKLDISCQADVDILYQCYHKSNPLSELTMLDNWGLMMFYCSMFMKECVYYVPSCSAAVIVDKDEGIIYDVYCEESDATMTAPRAVAGNTQSLVKLGFAFKDAQPEQLTPLQEDDTTLFVWKENVFQHNRTMFPLLSHA